MHRPSVGREAAAESGGALASGHAWRSCSDDACRPAPFFHQDGEHYVPTTASGGFWSPDTLGGRLVGGLLGMALEQAFGDPDFVPVRFCVDLMRPPPKRPLRVVTRLVRSGRRLRLADAELFADGVLVARANCQFLRGSAAQVAPTWQAPGWTAPSPNSLPAHEQSLHVWDLRAIPAGAATRDRRVEPVDQLPRGASMGAASGNAPVLGAMAPFAARQAWARENRELVAGQRHTPFIRVALAADFASPLANSSESAIDFINSDFTVYLHRLPCTEWLGFDVVKHHATDGVAIGECWLHDEAGPIGAVTVAALIQQQRQRVGKPR